MAHSKKSIYSALIANFLIAVVKFVVGAISNSAAMRAEGIHSLVDTLNEVLLLYGIRQSKKPADKRRPFGYGKELYFWSFIVSILIFGLGGGVSVYQGILHLIEPEPIGNFLWTYVVLGIALVLDGASLFIASKEFNARRGKQRFWQAVTSSKDPTSFVVLFEDIADVLGLLIVVVTTLLSQLFGWHWADGLGSLLVGLLLIAVSLILARESRSLLMGESIPPEMEALVTGFALADPAIHSVNGVLSTYQSPETIVLALRVVFQPELDTAAINEAVQRLRRLIKSRIPEVHYVIVQPEAADIIA